MPPCAPQRFLANDRNLLASATLTPSSVDPVEDLVVAIPVARTGSADARLSGAFTGAEEAEYDVEIVDTTPTVARVSAPVYAGAGSSRLANVSASGVPAQEITIECVDAGRPATYAAVAFEGVTLQARTIGAGGNGLRVSVDQAGLIYTETDYSLLVDLSTGDGGPTTGREGAGFDWDTAVLGADDLIPTTAHRVAFGEDRSTIYLAYKRYDDNRWLYHFVPAIKRVIPKGTPVLFVTGGREITISDGGSPDEVYSGVATVYDLLSQIRASSQLVTVEGVVANDRSPTGQASRELLVRTDAHVEPSTGSGSDYANGFADAFANSNARTELITARCYAITGRDHPLARLGAERWQVSSSLGGYIADAITGEAFVDPNATRFGFTIPRELPPGYGVQKGRFSFVGVQYVARAEGVENPPVCPVALTLGTEAVDQTITLRWTKRPSGACDCSDLPVPVLGGRCLGVFSEGGSMGYSNANRLRLVALYEWFADYVRVNSAFSETGSPATVLGTQDQGLAGNLAGGDATFVRENLRTVVGWFEDVLAQIDALVEGLSPDVRADGETAWDAAVAELQADLDALATGANFGSMPNDRYRSRLDQVLITAGISPSGKSDASTLESGDGCWRDWGDAYYFAVEGSVGGGYAPLFANHPYYSSRRATNEGAYFATKEFGLQVNVQCPGDLLEGDTITLAIGDAGWPATYQVGDELTLPIIAEAPLYLAGGRDDDSTQRWSVTGDVDGPFPEWAYVPGGSPTSYADAGLSWDLVEGGIPTAKGDRIRFAIEGGHFRWRKDGGAWSSAIDVPVASVALDSGLSVAFTAGAAPSFAAGDVYSFRALQPWAVSHVRNPKPERWRWINQTGAETLDVDLGASADLDAIAIAMHTIPDGATLTLEGGVIAAGEWSEPITWREGLIVQPLTQARTARYLRLTLAGAGGGAIGWIWVGEALSTRYSAEVQVRGATRIARANDDTLYQGGATLGRTRSALVSWPAPFLTEDDAQALIDMIEHVKSNDDEPLIVVPHVGRPGDAVFGRVVEDEVEFEEQSGQNRNTTADRRYSVQFTVAGVWRQ